MNKQQIVLQKKFIKRLLEFIKLEDDIVSKCMVDIFLCSNPSSIEKESPELISSMIDYLSDSWFEKVYNNIINGDMKINGDSKSCIHNRIYDLIFTYLIKNDFGIKSNQIINSLILSNDFDINWIDNPNQKHQIMQLIDEKNLINYVDKKLYLEKNAKFESLIFRLIKDDNNDLLNIVKPFFTNDKLKDLIKLIYNLELDVVDKFIGQPFIFNNEKLLNYLFDSSVTTSLEQNKILCHVLKNYKFNNNVIINFLNSFKGDSKIFNEIIDSLENYDIDYTDLIEEIVIGRNIGKNSDFRTEAVKKLLNKKVDKMKLLEKLFGYESIVKIILDNVEEVSWFFIYKKRCELISLKNNEIMSMLVDKLDNEYLKNVLKKVGIEECLNLTSEFNSKISIHVMNMNFSKKCYTDIYGFNKKPVVGDKLAMFIDKKQDLNDKKQRRIVEVVDGNRVFDILNDKYYKIDATNLNSLNLNGISFKSLDHPLFDKYIIENLSLEIEEKLPNEVDNHIINIDDKILFGQNYFIKFNDQILKCKNSIFMDDYYFDCFVGKKYYDKLIDKLEDVKIILQEYLYNLEKEKYLLELQKFSDCESDCESEKEKEFDIL